jgi:hypothetical protein
MPVRANCVITACGKSRNDGQTLEQCESTDTAFVSHLRVVRKMRWLRQSVNDKRVVRTTVGLHLILFEVRCPPPAIPYRYVTVRTILHNGNITFLKRRTRYQRSKSQTHEKRTKVVRIRSRPQTGAHSAFVSLDLRPASNM